MNLDYESLDKVVSGNVEVKTRNGPPYIGFSLKYITNLRKEQEYFFATKDMQPIYAALNELSSRGKISFPLYDELETMAKTNEIIFHVANRNYN